MNESVGMDGLALLWSLLPTVLKVPPSMCHAGVFQNKLHRAMEIYINLDKEILLRNEMLGKIEKETIQAEEVRGYSGPFLMCASFCPLRSLSKTPDPRYLI